MNTFRINLGQEVVREILLACYVNTVKSRNREFVSDDETLTAIDKVAMFLTTPSHKFGILLHGNCGNGKTTMLEAIKRTIFHLYEKNTSIFPKDFTPEIPLLSSKVITENFIKFGYRYDYCDILMIDDLGLEPVEVINYGMVYTPISDILISRYSRMRYTIISTNLEKDKIRPTYGNRIADRLNEMMWVLPYNGKSYRPL